MYDIACMCLYAQAMAKSLPSSTCMQSARRSDPEEYTAGADESMRRSMEQRSLGHVMHTLLVEFLRSFLRTPALEVRGPADSKARSSFILVSARTLGVWVKGK